MDLSKYTRVAMGANETGVHLTLAEYEWFIIYVLWQDRIEQQSIDPLYSVPNPVHLHRISRTRAHRTACCIPYWCSGILCSGPLPFPCSPVGEFPSRRFRILDTWCPYSHLTVTLKGAHLPSTGSFSAALVSNRYQVCRESPILYLYID